jgi:glycolate oxidase FAD binding subunit
VAGYDMARLHIGALGTLGAIATVAFKIGPVPEVKRTIAAWFDSVESAAIAGIQITNGAFMPEAVTLVAGQRATAKASELAADGSGKVSDNAVMLLVALAAGPATVERQVNDTTATLGGAMADGFVALDDDLQLAAWSLAGPQSPAPALSIRSTLKPTAALSLVGALAKSDNFDDTHIVAQIGFGTVEAHFRGDVSGEVIRSVQDAVIETGGACMIERCPSDLKHDLDVFGDLGAPLEVMRRMKQQFDPTGTLSPGRFAGRI